MSSLVKEFGKVSLDHIKSVGGYFKELASVYALFDRLFIGRWTVSVGPEGDLSLRSPNGELLGMISEVGGVTSTEGMLFGGSSAEETPKASFEVSGGCVELREPVSLRVLGSGPSGPTRRLDVCCFSRTGGSVSLASGGTEVTVPVPASPEWKGPWTEPVTVSSELILAAIAEGDCRLSADGSVYVRHAEVF
jgi:hypothetical protein